MQEELKNALIEKIETQKGKSSNLVSPIVTLEDFFEGNDDISSMGCNLLNHPGIDVFYQVLKEIRARENVQDVLVEIYDIEGDYWPFSEVVYILTGAGVEDISKDVERLQPSEVGVIERSTRTTNIPHLKEGYRIISLWWG